MEKHLWYQLQTHEEGQSLVEFALVLPLFLGLVMASITIILMIYSHLLVVNGANQGARVGAIEYGIRADNAQMKSVEAVKKVLKLGLKPGTYQIIIANNNEYVSVQVLHNFPVILPFAEKILEGGCIPIKYTATYKLEK